MLDGRTVWLIDTPGFDDSHVSDIDRLQEVSLYLTDLYKAKVNLTAIIYLQDIRVERIGGVALKNIRTGLIAGAIALVVFALSWVVGLVY